MYRDEEYVNYYLELGFLMTLGFLALDGVLLDLQKLVRRLQNRTLFTLLIDLSEFIHLLI